MIEELRLSVEVSAASKVLALLVAVVSSAVDGTTVNGTSELLVPTMQDKAAIGLLLLKLI